MHTPVNIPSPSYVIEERLLRENLCVIREVAEKSGAEIIVALKANATWGIFPIIAEYISGATASSLSEARLVGDKFGWHCHTYAPVYAEAEITPILELSSHITFNSIAQFERYGQMALLRGISCGLRINPEYSPVCTDLYNPCVAGSRLGVRASALESLPPGIEGLHCHNLCESGAQDLEITLKNVEKLFGHLLPHIKWLNMGGGHLITRRDYDREKLIAVIRAFREKYPHIRFILEPGSAFTWQTGYLVTTVEDIVINEGVRTLMMNASFACHMPDCLEMPYKPVVRGAHDPAPGEVSYRIGGNSCLAGDFIGDWSFDREPRVGDRLIFEDMIHYTMVKTTMFNGVSHPSIVLLREDGRAEVLRRFGYEDYRDRMD